MSDLHMELWDNSRYIRANEFEVVGDVLVLAGDTFYLRIWLLMTLSSPSIIASCVVHPLAFIPPDQCILSTISVTR